MAGIGYAPCRSMIAEDIRDLQCRTRHERRALSRRLGPLDLAGDSHSFRVTYLLALERSGTVGVAKALDVRPSALASASNPLLCGGQGVLGALADQARF